MFSSSEVVEHCCSVTSLQLGETMPNIAKDMDTLSFRTPLGVCAGITPFNFPAMIPLWVIFVYNFFTEPFKTLLFLQMFPVALVCGNTYVVKPSERDPGACMMVISCNSLFSQFSLFLFFASKFSSLLKC